MVDEMKKYFAETPKVEIRKQWESLNYLDKIGPLVKDVFDDWLIYYPDFGLDDSFYLLETNELVNKGTLEYLESFFLIYSSNGNTSSSVSN